MIVSEPTYGEHEYSVCADGEETGFGESYTVPDDAALIDRYVAVKNEWEQVQYVLSLICNEAKQKENAAKHIEEMKNRARVRVEVDAIKATMNCPQYAEWANEDARGE